MPTLYFSLCSDDSEPLVQKVVDECESFLEGKCILEKGGRSLAPEEVRHRIAGCDALIVVVDERAVASENSSSPGGDNILNERIRLEIVSAINSDILIIPLLLDNAHLPEKQNAPGALKRLLEYKTYRLRSGFWFEDLHLLLEDMEEELEFKRDVENKLSQPFQFNFEGRMDPKKEQPKTRNSGLDSCGPSELDRVIDSETLILADAQRKGNRKAEKEALAALGLVYTRLGQTQKAIEYFQKQLEIVRELGDAEEKCGLLANLGDAFAVIGNIDLAREYYQEQLSLAESKGYRAFVGSSYNGLGFVCVKKGQVAKGIECYLKALEIYRELEDHDKELELLVGIALNCRKLEELNQALQFFEQALQVSRYLENRKEEAHILMDLTEVSYHLGDLEGVHSYVTRAEEFLNNRNEPWVDSLSKRLKMLRGSLNGA